MANWISENWISLSGVFFAALAIPASALTARAWGNRRGKLSINVANTPLNPITFAGKHQPLKVTFHNEEIPNPHLLEIEISNTGPSDVKSSQFDSGVPVTIQTQATIMGIIGISGDKIPFSINNESRGGELDIIIYPQLIKKGETRTIECIINGDSGIEIVERLENTEVRLTLTRNRRFEPISPRSGNGGAVLIAPPRGEGSMYVEARNWPVNLELQ